MHAIQKKKGPDRAERPGPHRQRQLLNAAFTLDFHISGILEYMHDDATIARATLARGVVVDRLALTIPACDELARRHTLGDEVSAHRIRTLLG